MLVARHENEISGTTDVASHAGFASRRTTKSIDGADVTGWFTEDFSLAELRTLRARERIPLNRPGNAAHDGRHPIPTLQEVLDLARAKSAETGRAIAVYPETKHPGHFRAAGLPLEGRLVDALHAAGYRGRDAPVYIQSFEVASLQAMRALTGLPLVQLLAASGQPDDLRRAGDARGYASMATPAGLRAIAAYADGIGPDKEMVIPRDAQDDLAAPTALVADAHAAGLFVHPYTFRPENPFLPAGLRRGDAASPSARGDLAAEIAAFLRAGVDGFFTDDPGAGRAAVDAFRRP